ncbi:MAG: zinc metallopeptidase [Anaerolineales bacterium]
MLYRFDPMYWIISLPALILALVAQAWVRSSYNKYLQVRNSAGITGREAAQHLMRSAGLNLRVERARGELSDHYDPRNDVLRLSEGVANRASVASVAIVAHELGHALQDANAYLPLRLRSGLVPVVNFTSWLGPILFMLGLWLNLFELAVLGIVAFSGAALFALVTLPVEINASQRAMRLLDQSGMLRSAEERKGARRILSAAALTYIAALAQALSTLLYYFLLLNGRSSRQRR